MTEASGLVLALTTEANAERAEQLALALLERRLVACVSIHAIQSHYRWEGALQCSDEVQLLMKTGAHHLVRNCWFGQCGLAPLLAPTLAHETEFGRLLRMFGAPGLDASVTATESRKLTWSVEPF